MSRAIVRARGVAAAPLTPERTALLMTGEAA